MYLIARISIYFIRSILFELNHQFENYMERLLNFINQEVQLFYVSSNCSMSKYFISIAQLLTHTHTRSRLISMNFMTDTFNRGEHILIYNCVPTIRNQFFITTKMAAIGKKWRQCLLLLAKH